MLFSGSLRYNIEYGLKDCSVEKVKEAAKKANADDLIPELEKECDTGTELSMVLCITLYITLLHGTFNTIQMGYNRWSSVVLK